MRRSWQWLALWAFVVCVVAEDNCQEVSNVTFSALSAEGRLGRRQYFSAALQHLSTGNLAVPSFATRVIVFGGRLDGLALSDPVILNPGSGHVSALNATGDVPAARWGHSAHWSGAGSAYPPAWPSHSSTSGRFSPGHTFTEQGHEYRRAPASASGIFLFDGSGPGPCAGGISTHALLNGGECSVEPRGCSCVTLKVTSKNSGSPDSDTFYSDPASEHYPSLWSKWRLQVTSGPGAGYDGIISWNQGNKYNTIPAIGVQVGELSTFLITDRSELRMTSIKQDSMWVFGGRLADDNLSNDIFVLNTRLDGQTAGSASDLKVHSIEEFSRWTLGWSAQGTSACGRYGAILGGVGLLGFAGEINKEYDVNNPHTSVHVELDLVTIDSWQGETVSLRADGTLLWSMAFTTQPAEVNECGLESMGEEITHINVTWAHNSPTLTLTLSVAGTADSSLDLWWGIAHVSVTTLPRGMSWRLVAPAGDVPIPRAHHAAALFQDMIFVLGGSDAAAAPAWHDDADTFWDPRWSAGAKLGDCHAFNTSSERWALISSEASGPGSRSHHTMVVGLGDSLVVYGGQGPDGMLLNDLSFLAAWTGEWMHPEAVGPGPGRLAGHAAAVRGGRMWVYGGYRMDSFSRNVRLQDSLHSLHLGALVWQIHDAPPTSTNLHPPLWPGRRYGHALVPTLHEGLVMVGGAFSGDGDGTEAYGDALRLEEACADGAEAQRRRQAMLRRGELLMACDSTAELDWVDAEAGRLEAEAARELEGLEMRLTASYLAAVKHREQYDTEKAWFERGVESYTDLVAERVAAGRVYTDNLADLAQARRNRLEMEERFVQEFQGLEAAKLGLHMQLDQTKDRYAKAIAEIRRQGQVLARKKAEGAISAGRGHACAINALDLVQCWGRNDIGQAAPPDGTRFKAVSAGDHVTCGIRLGDGMVECWGSDSFGKLGRTPGRGKGRAALVSGSGRPAEQVSAGGSHVCAVLQDGSVECWGDSLDRQTAVPDGGRGMWVMVSCGTRHSCGIRARSEDDRRKGLGEVVCWGSGVDGRSRGVAGRAKWVSAGGKHSCALMENSKVVCWGRARDGQVAAPGADFFSTVSCGDDHTCGTLANGGVKCWGANRGGESSPPNRRLKSVSSGEGMSCGIDGLDHRVVCWGRQHVAARAEVVTCSRVWVR